MIIDTLAKFGTVINDLVNKARTASWKALVPLALDVSTFFIWAIATLKGVKIDHTAFAMWLGFLAGLGGFALMTFNTERKTDYGYLERAKAEPPKTAIAVAGDAQVIGSPVTVTEDPKQ